MVFYLSVILLSLFFIGSIHLQVSTCDGLDSSCSVCLDKIFLVPQLNADILFLNLKLFELISVIISHKPSLHDGGGITISFRDAR